MGVAVVEPEIEQLPAEQLDAERHQLFYGGLGCRGEPLALDPVAYQNTSRREPHFRDVDVP